MSESSEHSPTRVCVLTPLGRGAIAVVAVRGPWATRLVANHFEAANGRPLGDQPLARIVYGRWDGGAGEDLVVCRRGPDDVEIHCHGGTQSAARIVASLVDDGACEVDWREWVALGAASQLEAEARVALSSATTARTARVLLDQFHGALRRELETVLDMVDSNPPEARRRIERMLGWAEFGLHITRPWQVAIVGRPNVGKSTLINALAGYERAIAFDQPGTTRDVVSVVTALAGWPVELSDTAGLHATIDEIEQAGIALARTQIAQADLVLWLLDATDEQVAEATNLAAVVRAQAEAAEVAWSPARTLVVVNKCDLVVPNRGWESEVLSISAAVGTGIDELFSAVVERLIPDVPATGEAVPFTARQVEGLRNALQHCGAGRTAAAAERIREILAPCRRE